MSIISIIIFLTVVGVLLYLVNSVIPMPAWIKTVINVLAALGIAVWMLQGFGLTGPVIRIR